MNRRFLIGVSTALLTVSTLAVPGNAVASGQCADSPWMNRHLSADRRADLLLPRLTLEEKVLLTHTLSDATHSRETAPIPRLCVPALLLNNGPAGVSSGGPVQPQTTALPAPLGLAASFDPALARAYGVVEGRETRNVGRDVMEGPDLNIARVPLNGRTFEAYGEDPYLAGQITVANVSGIQSQGVVATPKHYLANSQEIDRDVVDERIDDRALREIYLPAFEAAVKQGRAGSVMCAKNLVNGLHACEHDVLQQGVLKDEWGFDGFVMSDFSSCHDTVRCATGGLDLELPSAQFFGPALAAAVQDGRVPLAAVDDHVRRVLVTMFRFGIFDRDHTVTPIDVARGGAVARTAAESGTVLLKNQRDILPLSTRDTRSLAVIGSSAGTAALGGAGSAAVAPLYAISPLEAITKRVAGRTTINYVAGTGPVELGPQPTLPAYTVTPLDAQPGQHGFTAQYFTNTTWSGEPAITRIEPYIATDPSGGRPIDGMPTDGWSIRWSGTFTAPVTGNYTFHLTNRARAGLFLDGVQRINNGGGFPGATRSVTVPLMAGEPHAIRIDWAKPGGQAMIALAWTPPAETPNVDIAQAVDAARRSDVAVVFASNRDTEAIDRPSLSLPGYQDDLISAVAAANPRTVVFLNTGGPVTMPWLDKVAGVLEGWYGGEEAGPAAAAVLFGDTDPAGRLPITFPKSLADLPTNTPAQYPGINRVAQYSEGIDVGYRHYDARDIAPLFPFGFGLSYTTFRLSHLAVRETRVSVDVTNTGHRTGTQVVQVYIGGTDNHGPLPEGQTAPPRKLAGFAKLTLTPGQHRKATIPLDPRAFAHWDTTTSSWQVTPARYTVSAGTSSRDLPLTTRVWRG